MPKPTPFVVCVALSAFLAATTSAQFPPDDGTRLVDQITFSPQRSGSVLQATGNRLRCDLVSLTADKIVVQSNQRTHEIEMQKVRSIRSTDGKFEYSPGDETFDSLLRRCRRIQGVTIGKLQVYDDLEPVESPERNPNGEAGPDRVRPGEQASSVANSAGANGTPAATNPGGNAPPETASTTTAGGTTASGGTPSAICANCMKTIPPTLQNGDRCPHCGVIFWDPNRSIPLIRPAPSTTAAGGNGEASHPMLTPSGANAQFPTASGGGAAPAAQAPGGGVPVTTVGGGSFSNIPLWMKVGFFGGMLAIAWLLLQRR